MNPLFFADWGKIHRGLRTLMWVVAIILAIVVVAHFLPGAAVGHHVAVHGIPIGR